MKKLTALLCSLICCLALTAFAKPWLTSLPKAEAQAKAERKVILLEFTGSDWCPGCKALEQATLSKTEFLDYAKTNFVWVLADFPIGTKLPDELKAANVALAKQFNVEGYPTLLLLKPDGSIIWHQEGYLEGGPRAMIAKIEQGKKK